MKISQTLFLNAINKSIRVLTFLVICVLLVKATSEPVIDIKNIKTLYGVYETAGEFDYSLTLHKNGLFIFCSADDCETGHFILERTPAEMSGKLLNARLVDFFTGTVAQAYEKHLHDDYGVVMKTSSSQSLLREANKTDFDFYVIECQGKACRPIFLRSRHPAEFVLVYSFDKQSEPFEDYSGYIIFILYPVCFFFMGEFLLKLNPNSRLWIISLTTTYIIAFIELKLFLTMDNGIAGIIHLFWLFLIFLWSTGLSFCLSKILRGSDPSLK